MTLQEQIKLLEEEKRRLLNHCVGMSYNMQQVFKINKEIDELECKIKEKRLVKELNLKGSEESQDI